MTYYFSKTVRGEFDVAIVPSRRTRGLPVSPGSLPAMMRPTSF